jgi:RHS repeat-associated protein
MLGSRIHQLSMEAGARWMLNDVTGKPIRAWDSRGHIFRTEYDPLRRPVRAFVTGAAPASPNQELLTERLVYGEQHPDAEVRNLRGRLYLHLDQAGAVSMEAHDFKGNPLDILRRIAAEYKKAIPWNTVDAAILVKAIDKFNSAGLEAALAPLLEAPAYASHSTYDALNRPLAVTAPDGSIYRATFNEANLLDRVDVNLRGAAASTPFVRNIDYDAKGQRTLIAYGNGAQTTYGYDPLTFRLNHLKTTRPAGLNGLSGIFAQPTILQDLRYVYDPAGNITRIADSALKTAFHDGQQVEPACEYIYDAIYRLIEARGREHIGQTAPDLTPPDADHRDLPFAGHRAHANDLQALRNYIEQYTYDAVGNFASVRHNASAGNWTRRYDYEEKSLIEPAKQSNRLTRTTVGNGINKVETYAYKEASGMDAQGCMTAINSMAMIWDYKDQFRQVDLGGGGTAWYVYDSAGQRVRKVIHRANGTRKEERIYVGGYEVYRAYDGDGQSVDLERETLHVMDDQKRIAIVETKSAPAIGPPLIRYQLGNHLGSGSMELDKDGELISYEEYHPYGTSSFQAKSAAEVSLKRYRYTGKERDEETGFNYHGARYYATWLGRWNSCDPIGPSDAHNLYTYCRLQPVSGSDPSGRETKDNTKPIGSIAPHKTPVSESQGLACRNPAGEIMSRSEHIQARKILELQTTNPETGTSPINTPAYNRMYTLKTPLAPASTKDAMDNAIISDLHEAQFKGGPISRELADATDVGSGAQREIASYREAGLEPPENAIQFSEHVQYGEVHHVGKSQALPGPGGATPEEVEAALAPLKEGPPPPPAAPPAVKPPTVGTTGPGVARRSVAAGIQALPKAVQIAGQVATVFGSISEADKTDRMLEERGVGTFDRVTNTTAVLIIGVAAGVADDAFAAAQIPAFGAPVITQQSWNDHSSGPIQHAAAEAYRGILKWAWRNGY